MNARKKSQSSRQRGGRNKGPKLDPAEFWNPVPQLPDPEPITVTTDPTIVVRSIGEPPLYDQGRNTSHEIHRVLVRSSLLASALADVAGLLEDPEESEPS